MYSELTDARRHNLIEILRLRAKKTPDFVLYRFLTYDEDDRCTMEDHTIRETYETALSLAYTLKKKGLKKGDRAIILSMQDYGTICAVYGCMMAGVAFTLLPPPLDDEKTGRLISVLKSCQPKALISNYALEQDSDVNIVPRLVKEAFRNVITLRRIYTDKLIPYKKTDVIEPLTGDDLVYLQYTSGSTSAPKGVRILYRQLMANMEQCQDVGNFNDVTMGSWVPYFHNLGLTITICMPMCTENSCMYFLQTLQFLERPKRWLKMVSDYKLMLTLAPNSAYDACTRIYSPEEAAELSLSQVTMFMNGSEFISPVTLDKFCTLFGVDKNTFASGYGLAEAVCLASVAVNDHREVSLDPDAYRENRLILSDAPDAKRIVGLGIPVKHLTVLVCNPKTLRSYKDMHIGEIFVSGATKADGYWNDPKESRKFHYKIKGYEGEFYRTGDLGFKKDGYIYLTGRRKEMFIVNGHNIYPGDLTLLVQENIPELAAAALGFFGCMTGDKEQAIACIESRPDIDFERYASKINTLISGQYGFSFYDTVFVPLNSLPRTDNRKLQLIKAKNLYQEGKLEILYSSRDHRLAAPENEDTIIDKSIDMADEILFQVKSVFDKVLNIEQYSLNASFLELGGDSLTGYELLQKIEERFHVRLDLRELLQDPSVNGISAYLRRVLSGEKIRRRKFRLTDDCVLEEAIHPRGEYEKDPGGCRRLFLTGATGFLGAHLIASFVEQYPHDGLKIICLVRAESPEAGMKRIISNMKHYHTWKEWYAEFLDAVPGDLSQPLLGLNVEEFMDLADSVDAVFHSGALLNFVYPYSFLKQTNVGGTIETLRLACTGSPKYYHYVSSYSVYDTPNNAGKRVYENDELNASRGFTLAYSETKWVSEKLVRIAEERGLRVVIYRPGDIIGSHKGIWDVDDMISRMIVGTIQMKMVPPARYCMQLTPADYVADAIVCISKKPEALGQAFNIINPKPTSIRELVPMVRRSGYRIRYVPFPVWKAKLNASDPQKNALAILSCLFDTGTDVNPGVMRHFAGKETKYDTSKTALLLNRTGIKCPEIDQEMIDAYLGYFKKLGYI